MLKIVCLMLIASTVLARPEPPVNSYLPPSNSYGPPGPDSSGNGNGNVSGQRASPSYGALRFGSNSDGSNASEAPSHIYGAPGQNRNGGQSSSTKPNASDGAGGRPSTTYGTAKNKKDTNGKRLSTAYGVPVQNGNGGSGSSGGKPVNSYTSLENGNGRPQRPPTSYGPPSDSYGPPASGNGGRNSGNGNGRERSGQLTNSYDLPSDGSNSEYLPPRRSSNGDKNGHNDERRNDDGYNYPQGRGNGGDSVGGDNESNEPAKYEFSYEVQDAPNSLSFGHSEMRDGDFTTGQYNVLLPDGRKQIVEYKADQSGYRPQVRYEDDAIQSGAAPRDENGYSETAGSGDVGGYDYNGANGSGIGDSVGEYLSSNGAFAYSNGLPNGSGGNRNDGSSNGQRLAATGYSSGRPNPQDLEEKGYPREEPSSRQFSTSGQDSNGNGYSSGRPRGNGDDNIRNGNGKLKRNGGNDGALNGSRDGNGYPYNQSSANNFGPGGQNGENNGSGYRY